MKKRLAIFLVLFLVTVSLTACDDSIHHWEFSQQSTEVKSIRIMSQSSEGYNVLAKEIDLSNSQALFDDVHKLEYKKYWPNPTSINSSCGYIVVIEYNNGDREIIAEWSPVFVPKGEEEGFSWWYCSEEQFTKFIQKYLSETV